MQTSTASFLPGACDPEKLRLMWPPCLLLAAFAAAESADKQFAAVYTPIPPAIDGALDDVVWQAATLIEDMHEVDPIEFSPAEEQVEVRVLYDEDYLYVGADIIMRTGAEITAHRLAQGSNIDEEDRFKVVIDPYNNQRSGYDFRINPNGVREEGLYGLLGRPNTDWNGIWDGRARMTERGWSAELAIPFKTLNFDPDNHVWGISFSNKVSARNEQIAWTSRNNVTRPGTLGTMTGIDRAKQGRGLDVVPSLSLRREKDYTTGNEDFLVEPSIDVFYKLTPLLTAALTVNTDFSAAEVDDRVVNLERFPVFFPEKRAFFLQDADMFSFGALTENGIPFFSRRIGLDDNRQPVDIIAGAKLTGRVGPFNVGILDVVQESPGDDVNLFVGRGYLNVLKLSTLGLIYTHGAPDPDVSNSVAGIDFNYINRDWFGGKGGQASFWYLKSDTDGVSASDEAYGFDFGTSRSRGVFTELRHERLGQNYFPALGFVNRAAIRETEAELGYRRLFVAGPLQSYTVSVEANHITDLGGTTESQELIVEPLSIVGNADDRVSLKLIREREVLSAPFEISDGVTVAPGDYSWNKTELGVYTGDQRKFIVETTLATGDFYDGDRFSVDANLVWQPSKYFALQTGIEYNDIDLDAGDFITRLMTMRADVAFSSSWSWSTLAQYDNETDEFAVNSRLRWIPRAGQEMILVVNHSFLVDEAVPEARRVWRSLDSDVVLKAHYTFRY